LPAPFALEQHDLAGVHPQRGTCQRREVPDHGDRVVEHDGGIARVIGSASMPIRHATAARSAESQRIDTSSVLRRDGAGGGHVDGDDAAADPPALEPKPSRPKR
jgi:hypothetical protein